MSDAPRQPLVEIIPPSKTSAQTELVPAARRSRARRSPLVRMLAHVPGVPTAVGLWLYLMDDEAPDLHRLLILLAILYLLDPIDIIPDFMGLFGFADDAAVALFVVKFIGSKTLEPYRFRARKLLRGEA